ncbi:hypothetical protein [Aliidiomarina indica]|uniref:hypothetical protein n=1 Tax=Aliidiomarina indica TaxID=2749147 RepID=UPI00188F3B4A|nr:hypothetical protein [Aliidiomarina indica]
MTAATMRGWLVEEATDTQIIASIIVRTHKARVVIPYSETQYSIVYDSSDNLRQRANMIHRNYNRWVYYLDNDIRRQFNLAILD